MDLNELKAHHYLFNPKDFGRVFVFVDFGNVRPWAKDLWLEENKYRVFAEIDIQKLAEVCNWIKPAKKFFYYGYFKKPDFPEKDKEGDSKHKKSIFRIDKARRSGFEVKAKEIKMIPHYDDEGKFVGKFPKCNFDVEMTMTLIQKMEKYDTVMLFSGDSDFGGLLGYLKSKGKKVIIVCTRNRMSTELQKVADMFVPAETLKEHLKYTRE
jgi:uncharacterized LabA/DUF88 family protein